MQPLRTSQKSDSKITQRDAVITMGKYMGWISNHTLQKYSSHCEVSNGCLRTSSEGISTELTARITDDEYV